MSQNPYEASIATGSVNDIRPIADNEIKATLVALAQWQTFISALCVIACLFFALIFVVQMLLGQAPLLTGVVLTVLTGQFFVLPTLRLFQAIGAIRRFASDRASLQQVLDSQRVFWKTVGILAVIAFAFYALLILFALVGFGAFGGFF